MLRELPATVRVHSQAVAVVVSTTLAGLYLAWQPRTTDLAAQTFRADLWERAGFVIWNPDWYGGHPVPGYSLLYPPLGAWLGPALLGALAAIAATWLFGRLAVGAYGRRAWLGVIWFGLAAAAAVYSGRITFALGLALGLGALLAVQRRRTWPAGLLGLLTAAASPVAGLFLLLACAAILLASRAPPFAAPRSLPEGAALAAGAGALLALLVLGIAFPSGGHHPFGFGAYLWIPLLALALLLAGGRREPVLVWGALLYAVLGLGAVLVDTPLGGNVTRLGATFAGPVLAILLLPRRALLLAALAVPLLYWQWEVTVEDVARAERDPSTTAAYHQPLLEQLEARAGPRQGGAPLKVHVPPTRSRWEAVHVAERFPIARGWLRQEESDDFPLFRDGGLDPGSYQDWLSSRGVSLVAVADAQPDYLARAELELIERDPSRLEQVWSNGHWRLYEVADTRGASPAGADVVSVEPDRFTVRIEGREASLPLRYSPYFQVADGAACVERDPEDDQRTLISRPTREPASITVEAQLSLGGFAGRPRHCSALP